VLIVPDFISLFASPQTPPTQQFLQWLSWTLPGYWLTLIAIPIVVLYAWIDKLFREAEFTPAMARSALTDQGRL
jgi:type II secretory pathway component PulF